MMNARYKEVAQIGIYTRTGQYVEFKAGETKEVNDEVAEALKIDSRFEITDPKATGNEAPAVKGKKKKDGDINGKDNR
jgi:hypothetical protein